MWQSFDAVLLSISQSGLFQNRLLLFQDPSNRF